MPPPPGAVIIARRGPMALRAAPRGIRPRFDPDLPGLVVNVHILDMPRCAQPQKTFVKLYISHD